MGNAMRGRYGKQQRQRQLHPEWDYLVNDHVYTGAVLMYAGMKLPALQGDFGSMLVEIRAV